MLSHRLAALTGIVILACDAPPEEALAPLPVTAQCGDYAPGRQVLFGDLHVHTSYSFDAYIFETRNDPADAYAFARGAEVGLAPLDVNGNPTRFLQLERPLDFAAATDHSEYLGETHICTTPGAAGYESATCRAYRNNGPVTFAAWGSRLGNPGSPRIPLCNTYDCAGSARTVWQRVQDAAAAADDPCDFTAFNAYEWTGSGTETATGNLHRNLIFAGTQVPAAPISFFEEPSPDGLLAALDATCRQSGTGCDVVSIPHNSNLSNGLMFQPYSDPALAAKRAELEPLVELIQHKGASECAYNPLGGDELCAFEQATRSNQPDRSFAREALKIGLRQKQTLGVNPFEVGFIASTDTHNGTPGATGEGEFAGHVGTQDAAVEDRVQLIDYSPGGLAAVWAEENTRPSIFAAMKRRETYATSGTRMSVRLFGGWSYPSDLCSRATLVEEGYAGGVPMGARLLARPGGAGAPRFVVSAQWDPGTAAHPGTLLAKIQIVKGWVDGTGATRERVFDVAGSGAGTVDLETCATAGPGHTGVCTVWTDPSFNAARPAFYYARVLENPSCRWSQRECNDAGVDCSGTVPSAFEYCCSGDVPKTIQERAWSSPIWYAP
jgi:hypothetical protein